MNLTQFPRRGYVTTSTPLERMDAFAEAMGHEGEIWIKRDDLLPGAAGGNKTRKLDFAIGKAMADGHDSIVTCGAPQSNHCRLTLSWCVTEGIDCHFVLEERTPGSYDPEGSGNLLLYRLLGVKSVTVVPGGSNMQEEMEKVAERLQGEGKKPHVMPVGASTPVGSLGYAACALELQEQMFRQNVHIDALFVPSGSAGTQAGLLAGVKKYGMDIPVYGINVGKSDAEQSGLVRPLAKEVCSLLGIEGAVADEDVVCDDAYFAPGYSLPSAKMVEAVELLARTEAILLDPVYTGKTMAGMIDYLRTGRIDKKANVLFLHTGGSPALYAYSKIFK